MVFLQEPAPVHGRADPVAPGVRRIVAPNGGPMTYHGTNTYLVDEPDGSIAVLDPGPDDAAHVDAVAQAGEGRIAHILVSHTHTDHFAAAAALRARTGATVVGWHETADPAFVADRTVRDGEVVAGLATLFTPGHAADHVCWARPDGVVFTADHVMGWASSVVSPPGGHMGDYMNSLEALLRGSHTLYLPGHGPPITAPRRHVRDLLAHRLLRERAIIRVLRRGPADTDAIAGRLYLGLNPVLLPAARRTVLAHLHKLRDDGSLAQRDGLWNWTGDPADA